MNKITYSTLSRLSAILSVVVAASYILIAFFKAAPEKFLVFNKAAPTPTPEKLPPCSVALFGQCSTNPDTQNNLITELSVIGVLVGVVVIAVGIVVIISKKKYFDKE